MNNKKNKFLLRTRGILRLNRLNKKKKKKNAQSRLELGYSRGENPVMYVLHELGRNDPLWRVAAETEFLIFRLDDRWNHAKSIRGGTRAIAGTVER
jgi:hypothetical protein